MTGYIKGFGNVTGWSLVPDGVATLVLDTASNTFIMP